MMVDSDSSRATVQSLRTDRTVCSTVAVDVFRSSRKFE